MFQFLLRNVKKAGDIMNTNDCLYFLTIAETRSFSKAAEQLYISQPYISRWASNFEKRLGTKLFDRSKYPIRLTENGVIFLEYACRFIELENEVYRNLKVGKSDLNTFSIGTSELTGTYILPIVITQVLEKYPTKNYRKIIYRVRKNGKK